MIGAKKNHKLFRWRIYGVEERIPSLVMQINPKEISISYKKLKNQIRTHGGFIEEHWGDDLDSVSCSGKTALFYDENKGLTVQNRRESESLLNFLNLWEIYKNNATQLDTKGHIVKVGRVRMEFDNHIYDGYFESFTIDEVAEEPFVWNYSFSFKVMKTFGEYQVSQSISTSQFLAGLRI